MAFYFMANPIIASYQRGRIKKLKERFEARRKTIEEAQRAAAARAQAEKRVHDGYASAPGREH